MEYYNFITTMCNFPSLEIFMFNETIFKLRENEYEKSC